MTKGGKWQRGENDRGYYGNSVDKIEPNLSSMTVELNQKIENQIFKLNEKKSGKLSKIGKVDCTQMLK